MISSDFIFQVCKHPFFWDSQKRLEFLVNISDRLEQESVVSTVVLFLESKAHLIIGQGGWDSRGKALAIDPGLLSDMNKYRKYDTHCVRDLLRVIRNKKHHFHELSAQLRKDLKLDLPTGFLAYFENRFPRLLLRAVEVACTFFAEEKDFSPFCKVIAPIFKGGDGSAAGVSGSVSSAVSSSSVSSTPFSHNISPDNGLSAVSSSMSESSPLITPITVMPSSTTSSNRSGSLPSYPQNSSGQRPASASAEIIDTMKDDATSIIAATLDSLPAAPCIDHLDVVVWHGGALSVSLASRGWWRKIDQSDSWAGSSSGGGGGSWSGSSSSSKAGRPRPMHLIRASTDLKYRTRLCTHWEQTVTCPMRKKGECVVTQSKA